MSSVSDIITSPRSQPLAIFREVGRTRWATHAFLAIRLCFITLWLFTSLYCLLAYIPFSYYWLIQVPVVSWLPVLVRLHPLIYWALLVAVSATLAPDLRRPATRRITIYFLGAQAVAGVAMIWRLRLASVPPDFRAFYWSLCALAPMVLLALVDFAAGTTISPPRRGLSLRASVGAAVSVAVVYAVTAWLRRPEGVQYGSAELVGMAWNLVSLLGLFLGLFALVQMAGIFARHSGSERVYLVTLTTIGFVIGALVLRKVIFTSLAFNGRRALLFALVMAAATAVALCGMAVRLRAGGGQWTFSCVVLGPLRKRAVLVVAIALVLAAPSAFPALLGALDWESVLQKLSILAIWAIALAIFQANTKPRAKPYSTAAVLLLALGVGCGYKALVWSQAYWPRLTGSDVDAATVIERYGGYDLSAKVAGDLLLPMVDDDAHAAFYAFLNANTNLPESAAVHHPEVNLAERLTRTSGPKPNIFIIVVDSLRQDYLAPYNPKVDFTPNIAQFGSESVVLENAFTRYAGTALSETTIWVGGMQVHKLYMQPFSQVNSLQKLVDAEGYTQFVTVDPELKLVLQPSPRRVELDKDVRYWAEYDLGNTLKQLESEIDTRGGAALPVFFFSQPHNIHGLALFRHRAAKQPRRAYPGFKATVAAELERMDAAFGEFIAFLKARRMYDNSIIVLTSDHGECFGESGRLGHTNTLFPQVTRIPLIIHLPAAMRDKLVWDSKAVAFSGDVTPSLYYLLGHRPIVHNPVLGRPLFTATRTELESYLQPDYLLVSSYSPVYAILSDRGRSLFIVDARGANYFYDLVQDPQALHNQVTETVRERNEALIRKHVEEIDRFYGFDPAK